MGANHPISTRVRAFLVLLPFIAAAGCEVDPPEGSPSSCVDAIDLPGSVSTDILFVIDDSRSMAAAQQKVVEELELLVDALASNPLHFDFQMGVVTTSVTMNIRGCDPGSQSQLIAYPHHSGRLQRGKDLDGQVIEPSDPKIARFDHPELLELARRMLGQGIVGSGQEMGFEAMRLALTEPLVSTPLDAPEPGNLGFLRPGARLLVVIVSDEDDCSDPSGTAIALTPACGGPCETDADCEGEGAYCLPDGIGGRACHVNHCETPEGRALLEPVSTYVDFLSSMDDGTGLPRETFLAVIGSVDPSDPRVPVRCGDSEGVAVRYVEAVEAMGERGHIASICADDFAEAINDIASLLVATQIVELRDEPIDPRLLEVIVDRGDGSTSTCSLDEGFIYHPPSEDVPPRLEMIDECRLEHGDEIRINLICAR